jgi:Sulfotransferase domain
MLPNCFVLGAQKSASTFVARCLEDHPEVFIPSHEVRFFENPVYLQTPMEKLEKVLEKGNGKPIIAIKRPELLSLPECAPRLAKHCPEAKLVAVLRHPVERAISGYYHYMDWMLVPFVEIERGIPAIINNESEKSYRRARNVIDFGFYYKHLSHYLNYFRRDQIHIELFDDLKSDPLAAIHRIYKFLGVDDEYVPKSLNSRPFAAIYSMPRLRFRSIRFIYRKHPYTKRELVRVGLKWVVLSLDFLFLKPFFSSNKPRLSDGLGKVLIDLYRDDIENLEKLLGRDLTIWKRY